MSTTRLHFIILSYLGLTSDCLSVVFPQYFSPAPRAPKRHKSQHQCPNLSLCFHTNPYNPIFPLKPECIFEIVNQITSLPCLQASSAFTALKSKLYNASWRFPTWSSPCQLLGHHLLPLLILSTVLPSHEQAPCQGLWLFPSYMIPPMALKELERRRRRNNFRSAWGSCDSWCFRWANKILLLAWLCTCLLGALLQER